MSFQRSQNNYEILRCWVPVTTLKMVYNTNFIRFIIFSLVINVHSVNMINIARSTSVPWHFCSLFSKTETNEKDEKIITLTSQLKELLQRVAMEEKLRKDMERLVILQS